MRFKYYLRGMGMGIIFATLIMTVACVIHNNNLSDQEIIEKAKKLGMVMTETESENDLFGNTSDSESESESETEGDSEQESEIETDSATEQITETQTEPESETTTQEPATEEPTETDTQEPTTQTPPQHVEITQYVLHVTWGDTPKLIARELEENGIIEDWSDFRNYLSENGYAEKIRSGSYTITVGMTYEEIAKLITKS